MAKRININGAELIRYKQRLDGITESIYKTFVSLNEELGNVANNLVSKDNSSVNPLVEPMKNLMAQNDRIGSSMYMKLQILAEFITEQVEEYSVSSDEAKNSLNKLVTLISSSLNLTTPGTGVTDAGENVEEVLEEEVLDTPEANESNNEIPPFDCINILTTVSVSDEYKLATPMNSTYDEAAYNEGVIDYQVALIQNRMGTVDALNDRMDVIVNSYNYYKELGYSDELIAGMLGNMCQESTFNLDAVSATNCKGLYQWTEGRAPESWDLQSQLDRSVVEINTRTDMSGQTVWQRLQNCSTVSEYTEYFAVFFEGAASRVGEVPDIGARTNYANAMYYLIKNNFNV